MPVVTLLNHLKTTQLCFEIVKSDVWLKNQKLTDFIIDSHDTLWLLTSDSHEITLSLSNFKEIDFDAIVSRAGTSTKMLQCLLTLEGEKYNAYIRDNDDNVLMDFLRIGQVER